MAKLRESLLARLRLRKARPAVPVVRLAGVIGGPAVRGRGITFETVAPLLERAFKARNLKAVALAINSPGGSPVQSSLITERIRALSREKSVPVLAFVEDVGASGGYWLALAGDEIFADASSIVGSIGVIHASFGLQDVIGRLGIERRVQTAGAKKVLVDPFRPQDPADAARLQGLLEAIHDGFKHEVRARRGERLKGSDEDLFEGQVWTGRQAIGFGLIDGIGTLQNVVRERYGPKVRMPVISASKGWLQRRFGVRRHGPEAVIEAALDGAIGALAERALWARYGL